MDQTHSMSIVKALGIIHDTSPSYSPEMKGRAERKNRTFTELVVVIMLNFSASPHWSGEILLIVFHVLNRVPKTRNKISPYEI